MRPVCIARSASEQGRVEEESDVCVIEFDHFRMGKLNFDIDEGSLLKTYGLSTLAPTCVSFANLRLAMTERWDTGNGKILTMS